MSTGIQYADMTSWSIHIGIDDAKLAGDLVVPSHAVGVVLFVHGSGSSRHSPRNRQVAEALGRAGLATLLFDLLTLREEARDIQTGEFRFNIPLLASRVRAVTQWLSNDGDTRSLPVGYFGASTGAAAALVAAAMAPSEVRAVVSRGGRPDLAGEALAKVTAPTLLIVGGADTPVIDLNEQAMVCLNCTKALRIVKGATHLFEEPGALEQVAHLARDWFAKYLPADKGSDAKPRV